MLSSYIKKPHVLIRMQHCYFNDVFETYILHLHQHGYKPETIKAYCQAIEHVGRWLLENRISKELINEQLINQFIMNHLSKCKCPIPKTKEVKIIRAAANQLLKIISKDQVLFCVDNQTKILNDFEDYLSNVCGVAENTLIYRRRYILAFLKKVKILNLAEIEKISPQKIMQFIKTFSCHYKSGSIGVVSTSLRSFLRYLSFCGHNVKRLLPAIPRIPNYKLSSVPKFLNDNEIKRLLSVFNRNDLSGKRDYALARCFTDLGLRCCEVANIKIKDIDWRQGVLKIARTKSNQECQLPLPKTTGEAIADYLLHGRPKSNSEFVFVFHRAPYGVAVQVGTVRNVIRRAFKKAGFKPIPGTHILRHSFATKLLVSGSPLKEIADMLGHKNIDTTMIYTKVDLPNLKSVAMPWFGSNL